MAGRMGTDQVTLKKVPVVDVLSMNGETVVALKGSVPGPYNSLITIYC
jgi:ribosomal protein L3